MDLTFKNSEGKITTIATGLNNLKEVADAIQNFLDKHNFTSYYFRYVGRANNMTMIDVGSHSEFFYVNEDINVLLNINGR